MMKEIKDQDDEGNIYISNEKEGQDDVHVGNIIC